MNGVATSVSVNNEVTNDGTFTYTFDNEGNRLTRTRDDLSSPHHDDLVSYTWDARNRLTGVEDFSWNAASSSWVETESIAYTYDVFDDLIQRVDDLIGSGTTTTQYIWDLLSPGSVGNALSGVPQDDGGIILAFTNGSLSNRYLNGPNTSAYDQYFSTLAEENVGSGTTTWDLLDNQGSVRDVVDSNGNVLDHLNYNSFGQAAYESAPSVSHIDGYAGGLYDPTTQLVYFIHRWYDPTAMVWISADPSGFTGGDANLDRYVSNSPANTGDRSGLSPRDPDSDGEDDDGDGEDPVVVRQRPPNYVKDGSYAGGGYIACVPRYGPGGRVVGSMGTTGPHSGAAALPWTLLVSSSGGSDLAKRLMKHYEGGTGQPFTLDEDDMQALSPVDTSPSASPEFAQALADALDRATATCAIVTVPINASYLATANANMTLNKFSIHHTGTLTVAPDGTWSYFGSMAFSDRFDFDDHPSEAWSVRNVQTAIVRTTSQGRGFDVDSVSVPVTESSSQRIAPLCWWKKKLVFE